MPINKTGMSNQKFTMDRDIVPMIVLNMPYELMARALGNRRSRRAKSFENRVKIRPIGFESKKRILARTIVNDMALCRFELLVITSLIIVDSRIHATSKLNPIRAPSIFG